MRSQKNVENNLHRSQALKLNEMYSSYSFLKEIYEMHADFVSTFEHFLRNPTDEIKENYSENYEKQYIMYLNVLNNQEKALELFLKRHIKMKYIHYFLEME